MACKNGWAGFKNFLEKILANKADDVSKEEGKILDNVIGEGLYGGKILKEIEIEDWAKQLKKKFGTTLRKVDSFDNPKVLAQFDPNTNSILYKNNVTEYLMTHESLHAEEMGIVGFEVYVENCPLKGTLEVDYTNENWIRFYKREKYVHDKILKSKNNIFNSEELRHNYFNYDYYLIQLEKRKIKIPQ